MVKIEEAVVVRYQKAGSTFEILVDPEAVMKLREGKEIDVGSALAVMEIFKDARKAEKASEAEMEKIFGTSDVIEVARRIMKEGEFHPTAEQRRKMVEQIRNQIIEIIARNSVDPRTGLPHTRERIERAMEEAKVHIKIAPPASQINEVIKALRPVLPLKFGTTKLEVIIPNRYAPALYGKLKSMAKILREDWLATGLRAKVEIPAGYKVDFMEFLGNATRGEAIVKEVEENA